jgi:hypothetical protein
VVNLLTRFIYNRMNAIKLQLVRHYQTLPLDDFPEMAIRDYDGKEEGMIRKPGERSRTGIRSKSKALSPCQGPTSSYPVRNYGHTSSTAVLT